MKQFEALDQVDAFAEYGRVAQAVGTVIEGYGPVTSIGEMGEVIHEDGEGRVPAEVVGFRGERLLLMPLGEMRGIGPTSRLLMTGRQASVPVGAGLLGRVLDGLGRPIDGGGPIQADNQYPLYADPINPLRRRRISQPFDMGIRAINGLLTCGVGQKVGVFAGSGVGKSILLGMISRNTVADVKVIALIGERGREVQEFLERDLTPEARAKSVVVAATSDQPPLVRIRGAFVATAIAEYFRDYGKNVLLLMDSLTRFAHGQREVGLAIGEPPTTKGYTPSVFALLPRLLERVGTCDGAGSITGVYTILVEGDDLSDPIADSARAILDGHIVLSRDLVARHHFPAIDILQSTSRVMMDITTPRHRAAARAVIESLSTYQRAEDVITLGAYKPGSNARVDRAMNSIEAINTYLQQAPSEAAPLAASVDALVNVAGGQS